ncbi:MAG: hypothetical protein F6K58_10525 [Symploca sp. SIO2E9]|nr:hypothetical protein [Symploca sp. SIO2E9]
MRDSLPMENDQLAELIKQTLNHSYFIQKSLEINSERIQEVTDLVQKNMISVQEQGRNLQTTQNSLLDLTQKMEQILPSVREEVNRMHESNKQTLKSIDSNLEGFKTATRGVQDTAQGLRDTAQAMRDTTAAVQNQMNQMERSLTNEVQGKMVLLNEIPQMKNDITYLRALAIKQHEKIGLYIGFITICLTLMGILWTIVTDTRSLPSQQTPQEQVSPKG